MDDFPYPAADIHPPDWLPINGSSYPMIISVVLLNFIISRIYPPVPVFLVNGDTRRSPHNMRRKKNIYGTQRTSPGNRADNHDGNMLHNHTTV